VEGGHGKTATPPPTTTEASGFDLSRARTHAGRANACERACEAGRWLTYNQNARAQNEVGGG